jgi:hypothetical protein
LFVHKRNGVPPDAYPSRIVSMGWVMGATAGICLAATLAGLIAPTATGTVVHQRAAEY